MPPLPKVSSSLLTLCLLIKGSVASDPGDSSDGMGYLNSILSSSGQIHANHASEAAPISLPRSSPEQWPMFSRSSRLASMSLWRKKLVVHSNLAGVSNGHMQNPITPLLPNKLPSSSSPAFPSPSSTFSS